MQLELFPEYSREFLVENERVEENNNFEVLLYANDQASRELHIKVDSPEGNVIFSHLQPDQSINVYIDGNVTVHGNLNITGNLQLGGELSHVSEIQLLSESHTVTHQIGSLLIEYDVNSNALYLNGKETRNYFEIGKRVANEFKKFQDDKLYNNCKDFFNY